MRTAIYVRVSTESQSYEQQIEPCLNFCKMKGWSDIDVFKEVESSNKLRPVFEDLLRKARKGKYQNIVMWRIDRGWRKSYQFIMDFENLQNSRVNVCSVTEGFDPTTPIGKCMMTIVVALAELERVNISEATKARLALKKKSGVKLGRPFGSKDGVKRSSDGYVKRWNKRVGKQSLDFEPEHVDLKNNSK